MRKFYLWGIVLLLPLMSACTLQPSDQAVLNQAIDLLEVDDEGNTRFNQANLRAALDNYDNIDLTELEESGILYMIEEEKLAHDVYAFLYDKWGVNIFDNISNSELTHTAAVQELADRYGVEIPASVDELGVYTNSDLQALYNDLTAQGSQSLDEAFQVGAAIEEIDILDLEEYISQTDKADIQMVYENLMKGSRNHLRSFVRNMERNGFNYNAQYLENASYNDIVGSDIERGSGNGNSQGQGQGNSQGQGNGRR